MAQRRRSEQGATAQGERRQMNFNWRRSLALALHALREAGLLGGSVVILIGSYAHGATTWRSDVDLLVLHRNARRPKLKVPFGVHLHLEDVDKFRRRLAQGDDYAISALRFGKLLHDRLHVWESLRQEADRAKWPDWRDKISRAERRIRLGDRLLATGDIDAATEEYLLGATQISRAILLRLGIYPLSRLELSKQLRAVGQKSLAADIQRLIEGECQALQLRRIADDLQRALPSEAVEVN